MDKTSKVLVAEGDGGDQIFYVLGATNGEDGILVMNGEETKISFWSYVSRMQLKLITTTSFHKNLWISGLVPEKEWFDRYESQKIPLTEEDVEALETLGVSVPPKSRPSASKDKKNKSLDNFTSVKIVD